MNVNLHLLNASGSLDVFADSIKDNFAKAIHAISKGLDISNVDVVVYDNPFEAMREVGIGGYAPNANTIFLSLDPKFPKISQSIENELKRTLAHEMHHCMRWAIPGYANTLLEALVTEGLADHFDIEVNGGSPEPWCVALNRKQTHQLLEKARDRFNNKDYDHSAWFFGSEEKNIPRYTGYSLGFEIVGDYLQNNPDKKPSNLCMVKAEEFL